MALSDASRRSMELELHPENRENCFTGKISELICDYYGNFEGFILETRVGRHSFRAGGNGLAEVIARVCRERMVISVYADSATRWRIRRITLPYDALLDHRSIVPLARPQS